MTVVYIDSVFLLNAAMDYLLCLVSARLAGVPLRRRRYLLAALAGGVYAVAVFLPGCGFLSAAPIKVAAGLLMALIAYGGEARLLRLTLLFFALSCGLAGCVLALGLLAGSTVPQINGILYTDVDIQVLLIAAASAYMVVTLVFRAAAKHGLNGELLPVRVSLNKRTVDMTALWDSGNDLREPTSGGHVMVVSLGALDGILPPNILDLLKESRLRTPAELLEPLMRSAPELRPRLIPYHAVGTASGLLLGIRTDWVEICGTRYSGMTVALSPTTLGTGYSALWGGEVRKGGKYDGPHMAMAAGTAGLKPGDPLHRGKRYAASAADKGTGGRASQPNG